MTSPEQGPAGQSPRSAARSGALASLSEIFLSARPVSYVRSPEERRVGALLRDAAGRFFSREMPVWTWTLTEGLRGDAGPPPDAPGPGARDVLDFIAADKSPGIFHLVDFHEALREPEIRRRLRDLYASCFGRGKYIVISSPVRFLPEDLARDLLYLELPLPDLDELRAFLAEEAKAVAARGATVDASEDTLDQLARAVQGLTLDEVRHAVRRALAKGRKLDVGSLPALLEEKRALINRSGLVEFVPSEVGLGDVGGAAALKKWLVERRRLFQQRDTLSAEIVPKGLLVMGISGCGKSAAVKAVASSFELPLYRIDMTAVFSGRHGPPGSAFVDACHLLEQVAPAVVWFDEIEMSMTTHAEDASGETGRIFGFFLTWMQEKPRGIFVAATANRIDLLPAEMIRKGRFDEVFFVDLPLPEERVEIFGIHLRRRGIDPQDFSLDRLIRFTEGWTGAEIEQCVVSAITTAQLQDRKVELNDLVNAAMGVVPLSKTMKEQVDHIRAWAFDRAARARLDDLPGQGPG